MSTSHTLLSPLSGCLDLRCPHYTGRKPDKDDIFTRHWTIFFFPFFYSFVKGVGVNNKRQHD